MASYTLPKELRRRLKRPLGRLIGGERPPKKAVKANLEGSPLIVVVGDATAELLGDYGLQPDIYIIDGREERRTRRKPSLPYRERVSIENPPGVIREECLQLLKEALFKERPLRIEVEGEEDLLALPLIATYPEGTKVLYGQPRRGIVVVTINGRKRRMARALLAKMGIRL